MIFSTMILSMYVPDTDDPNNDEIVLRAAIEQSLYAAEHGFNPWYTEHHFRGAWHSNPIQFAAYIAPQIPSHLYLGFGVLSLPYYHPVRLVESMNLLDQLTKGRTLYGLGSGFPGLEAEAMGLTADYHSSGRAAEETLEIMNALWNWRAGDPEYVFETPMHSGRICRRVTPAPYRQPHPILIRTARRDSSLRQAARNGWPAFLGTFGSPLTEQTRTYQDLLAAAGHAPEVVEHCLTWSTCDWTGVVVADSEAEALSGAREAKEEQLAIRRHAQATGIRFEGPVKVMTPGKSHADAFAAGGDMLDVIAGTPDTVAARLQEIQDMGINHLLVRFLGDWSGKTRHTSEKSMRLFAREIAPRFVGSADTRPRALSQTI